MRKAVMFLSTLLFLFAGFQAGGIDIRVGARGYAGTGFFSGSEWNDFLEDFEDALEAALEGENFEDVSASADNALAFSGGVNLLADFSVTEEFAVRQELGYRRHTAGFDFEADGTDPGTNIDIETEGDARFTHDLFELSVYASPRVSAGPGELFGLIGPRANLILGDISSETEMETTANGVEETETDSDELEPDSRLLIGAGVGAGYQLEVGPVELTTDLMYGRTFNTSADTEDDGVEVFLNDVSVGIGVLTSL